MGAFIGDRERGRLLSDGGHTGYYFVADADLAQNTAIAAVVIYRASDGMRLHRVGGADASAALAAAHSWAAAR